jgi:hypothetical protein
LRYRIFHEIITVRNQRENYPNSNLEEANSYEDEIKKSLVDISFDTSFLKEHQKKRDSEVA